MNMDPESPQSPKFPKSPEEQSQKPDDSMNSVLTGLAPEVREKVIQVAREHGLADHDPIWAVILAIRAGDTLYSQSVQDMKTILSEFQQAVTDISAHQMSAGRDLRKMLDETAEVLREGQGIATEASSKLISSEEYCEKTSRFALCISGGAILLSLWVAVMVAVGVSTLGAIQTERQNLVAAVQQVVSLQKLAGMRVQLVNEKARLEADWKQLQNAVAEQGMTTELEARKAELERINAEINRRQQEQSTREEKAYENKE